MRRKLPWFEIALAVVFLSGYIYAALSDGYNLPNRWFIRDDAYYYYKVAQNISEGHGSTFDGIHPTNGYHPLWLLVCIPIFALARYDLILPLRVLVVVTGLLQAGTFILLYRLIRSTISTPVAVLAAAYWAFDTYILVFLSKTGVESSVALFCIMLLLTLALKLERTWRAGPVASRQIALLGVAAALVVFGRLDLVFFALIMGLWVVLRGSPMRYLLPLDILAVFMAAIIAFLARLGVKGYYDADAAALAMAVVAVVIKLPAFFGAGLYTPPSTWRARALVLRAVAAVLVSEAVLIAVLLAGAALHIVPAVPRAALAYDALISLGLVLLIRLAAWLFRTRKQPEAEPRPVDVLRTHGMRWLLEGAMYYGIVGGSLALYMLWNRLAFGASSPVSGQVKRWWGTFWISVYGGPAKTWASFFNFDPQGDFNAWNPVSLFIRDWSSRLLFHGQLSTDNPAWQAPYLAVLAALFIVVIGILLLTRRAARRAVVQAALIPLFVGSWLQSLSYNVTGYAGPKEWYWLTEPILLVIVGALLVNVLIERLLARWTTTRALAWVLVGAFALRGAVAYWKDTLALNPYGQARASQFPEPVGFLQQHTPPGAIIGMTGGGNVGYFLPDRTIVNMDGLINSADYFAHLQDGTAADYLYNSGMRYVLANPDILSSNPYRPQYDRRLEPLYDWGGKDLMRLLPAPSE